MARRRMSDPTDYEHRHFVNLAAVAFLLALALVLAWTVKSIDEQETQRRCWDSGRRDCVPINAPPRGFIVLPGH